MPWMIQILTFPTAIKSKSWMLISKEPWYSESVDMFPYGAVTDQLLTSRVLQNNCIVQVTQVNCNWHRALISRISDTEAGGRLSSCWIFKSMELVIVIDLWSETRVSPVRKSCSWYDKVYQPSRSLPGGIVELVNATFDSAKGSFLTQSINKKQAGKKTG